MTPVTLDGYLSTMYRPDCEYVDGMLLERNLGDYDHSSMQTALIGYFGGRQEAWNIRVLNSLRTQVSKTRIRVPDCSVFLLPARRDPIALSPAFICIEVLSQADAMEEMQERIDDYVAFGVQNIWVINPRTRRVFAYTADGCREARMACCVR
jgi:Uma2 family endonuclease